MQLIAVLKKNQHSLHYRVMRRLLANFCFFYRGELAVRRQPLNCQHSKAAERVHQPPRGAILLKAGVLGPRIV